MPVFVPSTCFTSVTSRSLSTYLCSIRKYPVLDKKEERVLINNAQTGDEEAMSRLCQSNLRLVVSLAKTFMRCGLPLEDLIQEGNCGLLNAVKCFDLSKDVSFGSYAVWHIRKSITEALHSQATTIRIPDHAYLSYKQGDDQIENVLYPVSLDEPLPGEDGVRLRGEMVADADARADAMLAHEDNARIVSGYLNRLSKRDAGVLKMYYGIGEEAKNVWEIAERYGITETRVHMIVHESLKKMRGKVA